MRSLLNKVVMVLTILTIWVGSATATIYQPVSITGYGTYNHSETLLADGYIADEGTDWQDSTTVWWTDSTAYFIYDFGQSIKIDDIVLSVDNNDDYVVAYSENGTNWSKLFRIESYYGEVTWGLDTMSTISTDTEYVKNIDVAAVGARYLMIYAEEGDGKYSVSELQVYSSTSPPTTVPEPGTMACLGSAIAAFAVYGRKRRLIQ